jgi:antitoxin MazE
MRATVKVRKRFQITIPESVRAQLPLKVGERLDIEARKGEIIIRPVIEVPRGQAWFWGNEWQERVSRSRKDIQKGNVKVFKSVKEARKHFAK